MKKLTIMNALLLAGALVACTSDDKAAAKKKITSLPVVSASHASPATTETVTFALDVTEGVLQQGLLVWSDNCRGEFYSQDGTQATWQNKWAETCEVKVDLYSAIETAPTASAVTTVTTKYVKGTVLTVAGSSCLQRETWDADQPMRDEGLDATQAAFGRLGGIALSKTGEIYFTDRQAGRVLKIDSAGKLRRVAGLAAGNYSSDTGDGGSALEARIYWPYDVALDSKGNVYVSSAWGYRVRKIDAATGLISTFAGNGGNANPTNAAKATETTVRPMYLDFDDNDNLYIGSTYGSRLLKVYAASGTIFTLPGSYNYVFGVAWSPSGVYVANRYNYNVVRYDPASNTAATFAGKGTSGFSGETGPAVDAELSQPYGVDVGKDGTVYIADTYNNVIRAVGHDGKIARVIGPGLNTLPGDGGQLVGQFIGPSDIEIDEAGDMYIADRLACQIKKVVGPY